MSEYKYDKNQAVKETVRAIIRDKNRFLLVQRQSGDTGGGYWQFVGGGIDGQDQVEALKREVMEEVGLEALNIKKYKTLYNEVMKHNANFYTCNVKGKVKLQESEIQGYGWFTKEEALQLPLTPSTIKILKV